YVDGAHVAGFTTAADMNVNKPFSIGRSFDGTRTFGGKMDEIKMYTRALSAEEVKSHYGGGSSSTGKRIIVRSDDVGAWWSVDSAIYVTDYVRNMGIPQTIGILPLTGGGTIKLGDDSTLVNYLNALKDNPNIEFGLHGLDHHSNEFLGLSIPYAESKIADGNKIIKDVLNIEPVTFIPPYFAYDVNALNAAKNQGMT
ncbi:MAG: DUF2334 domain-containing protein, partial [Candidatus Atribacteria bacterium]